jgi:hypothetical protein
MSRTVRKIFSKFLREIFRKSLLFTPLLKIDSFETALNNKAALFFFRNDDIFLSSF